MSSSLSNGESLNFPLIVFFYCFFLFLLFLPMLVQQNKLPAKYYINRSTINNNNNK